MDTSLPENLFTSANPAMAVALGAVILALVALAVAMRSKRQSQHQLSALRDRSDTLWREVDDIRVSHFNRPDTAASPGTASLDHARYQMEISAYQEIWPAIWHLHERLGQFLRSVDAGESAGDLRLEARNAALEARRLLNRHRPFCHENVDDLLTRIIDLEIKAHLSACQYLDLVKEVRSDASDHDRRVLHDKYHSLHDGDARDLMSHLVDAVRHRAIRLG
ncbi:hypothetical protein KUV44_07170 [Marinobacter daepoensis]|uniref:Secreted protein n=1 Tax=Marinobacter daepoensis TaxID=262077 RepID=A0ABS3BLE8_9GAMM|nr:hypothetical protein [Marinobacter daepoensis]MBN7771050.1 hypothetical protein [Marinobacter daepoensis]MBY6078912.1 hypothetical protein [Marinobacter daepoensis]